jgi:sugar lactone lactonase YvrE
MYGWADGPALTAARFMGPGGIVFDPAGNMYMADVFNNRIRKITPSGMVSTIAGDGTQGYKDGPGATARFNHPRGIAIDAALNLYVADADNHAIRKITPNGTVSTLAGNGIAGFNDATGTAAQFNSPWGVTADAAGNVFVGDTYNNRVRKITQDGTVSTIAGSGVNGTRDGLGSSAQFYWPMGIAIDAAGALYVADYLNNRIRKIQ